MEYYAHSLEGRQPQEWHQLDEHLRSVSSIAAEFAREFGAEDWARIAGLWHDVEKGRSLSVLA